ncbi:MAG: radical SAM protein [Spartobacteria bacterium]|nr:radical SAM protein [Spartobacteria bacterium]
MKLVALYDIFGKMPNLALMKLSTYYKNKGYKTTLCWDAQPPDASLHYASCVFHHPRANHALAMLRSRLGEDLVTGGSGVDVGRTLAPEIDTCFPDYSLYEWSRYALGFLSRGCNLRCPFCLVPEKEGRLEENYATFDDFVPDGQRNVILLDANLLATGNAYALLEEMIRRDYRVNFSQTLDIRYLTAEATALLEQVKSVNSRFTKPMYYFSCNSAAQASLFREKQDLLRRLGRDKITVIVMFGFDKTLSEEYAILSTLQELHLIPFLQEYMPLPGCPPQPPDNYFDLDIDRIAQMRFRTNGRNNEKFLSFVSQRYFETFGQYYLPLLEARYRYNSKRAILRYLSDPSLVTRRKDRHFGGQAHPPRREVSRQPRHAADG